MLLNVRQIMDCRFTLCHSHDTIDIVQSKLLTAQHAYAIVVNEHNQYLGLIAAWMLLLQPPAQLVKPLIHFVTPLTEDTPISEVKPCAYDIMPVVNDLNVAVGVINTHSVFQYLPEFMTILTGSGRSSSPRLLHTGAKYSINDIIGQSNVILQLKEQIIAAAKTRSTVVILGETGTGKELVAHAIHRLSSRRHNAFVRINCAAIPDNLLESELFGYEAGAFTGAVKAGQVGKFEAADGGTIFLDEIGDMPLSLQAKILRVLQEKEIERIGGRTPIPLNVRIIAATHQNLKQLVQLQKFREDLYYRLHVIPIEMPPLRDHCEDIPLLVDFFLQRQALDLGISIPTIEREFMTHLIAYNWPGNVRELANIIELAASMAHGTLTRDLLPAFIRTSTNYQRLPEDAFLRNYAEDAEREAIIRALDIYKGNKLKVADSLGISRSSLYNKLKKYDIDV